MEITHVDQLPGGWPDPELLKPFNPNETIEVAKSIVSAVRQLLSDASKTSAIVEEELFHRDGFWRDAVALSWSLRTLHPAKTIAAQIHPWVQRAAIPADSIKLQEEQIALINLPNGVSCIRVPFTFTSTSPTSASCTAAFKVVRTYDDKIKVFTVTTAMQELQQMPWKPLAVAPQQSTRNGHALPPLPEMVDVLVVGGGHGGLTTSAYLKALGMNFVCVDREVEVGDGWAKRYDSACLHTTRRFSGLPYRPFPSDYPEYVPAKLVAKYYNGYARDFALPVYCGRSMVRAHRAANNWSIELSTGEEIQARILIFAIGVGGRYPYIPDLPGKDKYRGITLHSAEYKDASSWKGKRVAVVGSSTTSFDICHDAAMAGAKEVTMVQRGPTRVYPEGHIGRLQKTFWNDHLPVEVGDIMSSEDPIALQAPLSALLLKKFKDEHDPDYYEGLKRAGFSAISEGPVHQQIYIRAGAHYPDIGAVAAISQGDIKVKTGLLGLTETGLQFKDGELPVDVVVYATGFDKDVRKQIYEMLGEDIGLEPVWGLDEEGEVRGVWRPTRPGHGDIWINGGELQIMRYMGKYLALQVAAEILGVRPSV